MVHNVLRNSIVTKNCLNLLVCHANFTVVFYTTGVGDYKDCLKYDDVVNLRNGIFSGHLHIVAQCREIFHLIVNRIQYV